MGGEKWHIKLRDLGKSTLNASQVAPHELILRNVNKVSKRIQQYINYRILSKERPGTYIFFNLKVH